MRSCPPTFFIWDVHALMTVCPPLPALVVRTHDHRQTRQKRPAIGTAHMLGQTQAHAARLRGKPAARGAGRESVTRAAAPPFRQRVERERMVQRGIVPAQRCRGPRA